MRFSFISTFALLLPLTKACVKYSGEIYYDPFLGDCFDEMTLTDNGQENCSGAATGNCPYFATDSTVWNFNCVPGVSLSVTNGGRKWTYSYGGQTYTWGAAIKRETEECEGHARCATVTINGQVYC